MPIQKRESLLMSVERGRMGGMGGGIRTGNQKIYTWLSVIFSDKLGLTSTDT
jgi:hypothetical protein